jgi:hypothetical protein
MSETRYLLDTLQLQESVLTGRYGIALGMTPPILVFDIPSRGPQGQGRSVIGQFYRLGTIFQSVTWSWNGKRMQIESDPPAKCHRSVLLDSAAGSESGCPTQGRACHTVSQSPGLPPSVHLLPCGHTSTLTIIRLIRIRCGDSVSCPYNPSLISKVSSFVPNCLAGDTIAQISMKN